MEGKKLEETAKEKYPMQKLDMSLMYTKNELAHHNRQSFIAGAKYILEKQSTTVDVEQWYHNWMKEKGKSGEVATVNVLDMLKDFALQKSTTGLRWVKASTVKEINYPTCIKLDGGGAPYYTTVCSMEELKKEVCEPHNTLETILVLDESSPSKVDEKESDITLTYKNSIAQGRTLQEAVNLLGELIEQQTTTPIVSKP